MTNKRNAGFSYAEILIALALFAILLAAALPMLNQSARNLAAARDGHAAHLNAQNLMLAVRDALLNGEQEQAAGSYAARLGVEQYSIWIVGETTQFFYSPDAPDADISVAGFSEMSISGAPVIVVVVWNEHGYMAGRAIGVGR